VGTTSAIIRRSARREKQRMWRVASGGGPLPPQRLAYVGRCETVEETMIGEAARPRASGDGLRWAAMTWRPAAHDYGMRRRWAEMTLEEREKFARRVEEIERRREARRQSPARVRRRWGEGPWYNPETWGVLGWPLVFVGWIVLPVWGLGLALGWW
jgi:hypothetical protein